MSKLVETQLLPPMLAGSPCLQGLGSHRREPILRRQRSRRLVISSLGGHGPKGPSGSSLGQWSAQRQILLQAALVADAPAQTKRESSAKSPADWCVGEEVLLQLNNSLQMTPQADLGATNSSSEEQNLDEEQQHNRERREMSSTASTSAGGPSAWTEKEAQELLKLATDAAYRRERLGDASEVVKPRIGGTILPWDSIAEALGTGRSTESVRRKYYNCKNTKPRKRVTTCSLAAPASIGGAAEGAQPLRRASLDPAATFVPSTRSSRDMAARRASRGAAHAAAAATRRFPTPTRGLLDGRREDETGDAAFVEELRVVLNARRMKTKRRARPAAKVDSGTGKIGAPNSVSTFLTALGTVTLLNGLQEQRLARIIARGAPFRAAAAQLADSLGRPPTLSELAAAAGSASPQEAARLIALSNEAREVMVEFNLRMVFSIANKYRGKGVDLSDLIPEGVLGLRKAIDKFDPEKGFKFSTYAHWWIRQAISRALADQVRDVRLPSHVVESLMKLKKVSAALRVQLERPPTYKELAGVLGIPLPRLVATIKAARTPNTPDEILDRGVGASGVKGMGREGRELGQDLAWEHDDWQGDEVEAGEEEEFMARTVGLVLAMLPKRERNVLRMRYGLFPPGGAENAEVIAAAKRIRQRGKEEGAEEAEEYVGSGLGLREVAATYGLSRERIRQIESDALRHIRMPWRMNVLKRVRRGEALSQETVDRLVDAAALAQHPWS